MFSTKPFDSILDLIKAFPDEQSCINHLEWIRWRGNVVSPFDAASPIYKCKDNKYKCRSTNKYFNVRTGTIFEGSKIKLQDWFFAIFLFASRKKSLSSYQLAEDLKITQKSAWFILSRLRYAVKHDNFIEAMTGVVQIDETFVGGKNINRHHDKKVKGSQGRSFKDKTPVVGLLSDGKMKAFVIADTKAHSLEPIIKQQVSRDAIVVTDEWAGYNNVKHNYHHEIIDHSKKRYVNENGFTTNSVEGFWSLFKKNLIGIHHNRVTAKHLQGYADESVFRYNHRKNTGTEKFNIFLEGTKDKRLTYQSLINK